MKVEERHITSPIDLRGFGSYLEHRYGGDRWLSVDLETRSDKSNLEDWHPSSRIVSLSLSPSEDVSYVVPLSHKAAPWYEDWQEAARQFLPALKRFQLIGHNLKYDIRWLLSRTGVDLTESMDWCTMAAAHIMDENGSHGLKDLAVMQLGVEPWGEIDLSDAETLPWEELAHYNALDTAYTYRLAMKQMESLRADPDRGRLLWYITRKADRVLTRIEVRGIHVDMADVVDRAEVLQYDRNVLYDRLVARVPQKMLDKHLPKPMERLFDVEPIDKDFLSWAPTSKFFKAYAEEFWPVLEETDKRQPSWNKSVLTRLSRQGHADAADLLKYRSLDKQLTTYLTRWPEDVDAESRLHPTYNLSRVVTGRLSCENPNMQQVPKALKPCFTYPDGYFVQADFSQLEVRIMAHLSGDDNLRRVYHENRDVYRETGGVILDKDPEDLTDEERFTMKATVLGFLYGMMPPSFVNYARDVFDLDLSLEESEEFRDGFFRQYPGVATYHERQRRFVRQFGYVDSPVGRRRRLPQIWGADHQAKWKAERQAINFPCQSFGSELMLLALYNVDTQVDHEILRAVGTVHDSGLFEASADLDEQMLQHAGEIMANPDLSQFGIDLTIPIVLELEAGPRWGEVELEVKVRSTQ